MSARSGRAVRPVSVASFAQAPNVRRADEHNEAEGLLPVIAEVFGAIGITKDDVDFICSGSTDYLIGGPFSFVMALDAVGVWPPRSESHVEMDGAFALYEAWVLLQEGRADAALVYPFGRSSLGDLNEILTLQLDPYYMAPLWPDVVSLNACRPGRSSTPARPPNRTSPPSPRGAGKDALGNPNAQVANEVAVETLLEDEYVVSPLRRHALPPITDGAAAIVLAAGDKADRWSERPVWITGIDHRIETHSLGARDLTTSPVDGQGGRTGRGGRWTRSTWPRSTPRSPTRRSSSRRPSASTTGGQSTRRAVRWPPTRSCRPASSASARLPPASPQGRPTVRWPTPPRGRACNRTWSASWRVPDGRALCSDRGGPDPPQGQAGGCVHRRPGP